MYKMYRFKDYSTYQVILCFLSVNGNPTECGSCGVNEWYISAEGITPDDDKKITEYRKRFHG
jgi:hypothetical protein